MNVIWITWENQRRTNELAAALGVRLYRLISEGKYLFRVLSLAWRTVRILGREKPRLLIVQNPSLVLAALACFLKPLFGFAVVVDRHSNFKFHTLKSRSPKYKIFHLLSRYSDRRADLTIVTNEYLREVVQRRGGRGFTLQDKIPHLAGHGAWQEISRPAVVFICSHGDDEPIGEVLRGAQLVDPSLTIYITGKPKRRGEWEAVGIPDNVVFTGFLAEDQYLALLKAADAIMVLTTQAHTLLCGAYEAVALGKPLILSRQKDLVEYFSRGVVATDNTPQGIAAAAQEALANREKLAVEMVSLREELEAGWQERFAVLQEILARRAAAVGGESPAACQ